MGWNKGHSNGYYPSHPGADTNLMEEHDGKSSIDNHEQ